LSVSIQFLANGLEGFQQSEIEYWREMLEGGVALLDEAVAGWNNHFISGNPSETSNKIGSFQYRLMVVLEDYLSLLDKLKRG